MSQNYEGLVNKAKRCAKFTFDVTKDGGAPGTYSIGVGSIPKNAIVVGGGLFVETAFVGGTSVSLGVVAAADLAAAIVTANLVINYAAALIPVPQTGTSWIRTGTSDRGLIPVVVGTFTAGRMHVWIEYYVIR